MELIKKIWDLLTTLTDESQNAIFKKAEELGFNLDRGDIPLSEAYINLFQAKNILSDAIEQKKLIQLPITIQKVLLDNLENISSYQVSLINGSDEVINLVNVIEKLYSNIWLFGLHNLSNKLLGYSTKMNQLKNQLVKVQELQKELETGLKQKKELDEQINQIKSFSGDLSNILNSAQATNTLIQQNLDKSVEISQKASAQLASIQQNDASITQLFSTAKTNASEITAIEARIKEFFTEIENTKKEIIQITQKANTTVESNNSEIGSLTQQLHQLEEQINIQLQKATGNTLFHSFYTRQMNLNKTKNRWIIALGILIFLTIALTAYIAYSTDNYSGAFYLKLSMSIPLIYAIAFCTFQYSKERRLEEEYAFKSNISISLLPYKELVFDILESGEQLNKEKYSDFVLNSIEKIFTSPTDKILNDENIIEHDPEKSIQKIGKLIETIIKPFAPILKAVKE